MLSSEDVQCALHDVCRDAVIKGCMEHMPYALGSCLNLVKGFPTFAWAKHSAKLIPIEVTELIPTEITGTKTLVAITPG